MSTGTERGAIGGESIGGQALGREWLHVAREHHVLGRRGWIIRRVLLAADVAGLTGAFLVASQLFPSPGMHDTVGPSVERLVFLATPG